MKERKASFKVMNATRHSSKHNSREDAPKYLIEDENFNGNYYDLKYSDKEYLELAQEKYFATKKQTMQQKQKVAIIKETVLNLEEHHTVKDIENLFVKLNKKYGGHKITELSIHKDEGHFIKDGIPYYPTKHIIKKDGDWYIVPLEKFLDNDFKPKMSDFCEKVDITTFSKVINHHAHVKFSMYDIETGITGRMSKGEAGGQRIEFTANELGLAYVPSEKINSGKAIGDIKVEHDLKRRSQIKELFLNHKIDVSKEENTELKATAKDLSSEIKTLRSELAGKGLSKEDFARVNNLNSELKLKIKNKEISKNQVLEELAELKENLLKEKQTVKNVEKILSNNLNDKFELKTKVKELQTENATFENVEYDLKIENLKLETENKKIEPLREQNKILEAKVLKLEEKSVHRQDMIDLEAQNKNLEDENKELIRQSNLLIKKNDELELEKIQLSKLNERLLKVKNKAEITNNNVNLLARKIECEEKEPATIFQFVVGKFKEFKNKILNLESKVELLEKDKISLQNELIKNLEEIRDIKSELSKHKITPPEKEKNIREITR